MLIAWLRASVHPRIRGEDVQREIDLNKRMGSPPHTRGRSVMPRTDRTEFRFTPAYAGKIRNH